MIAFSILISTYFLGMIIHSFFKYSHDISLKKIDIYHKQWKVAFDMWNDHCKGFGYPKKESGSWMTYWELADYFDNSEKGKSYINHVIRNWPNPKSKINATKL